jgi:FixJ family two-component response regulator
MPSSLVVVVEDDFGSRRSLGRVLRVGGFESAMYASAEEFLNSRPRPVPLCLILDIQLSGQSGLDLQRLLNAEGSRVPFIVITAFDDDRVREEAEGLGCLGYLRKPCEGHAILALLRSLQ